MTSVDPRPGTSVLPARASVPPGPLARRTLDPRTAVTILLAASITIMAPGGVWFVPAALTVGLLLALSEGAYRRALGLPLAAGLAAAVTYLLPLAVRSPVVGLFAVMAGFTLRLVAVGGIAAHLVNTISPPRLTAALRAARIPSVFTVSGAVMLRFVPTIVAEAQAVRDAMRLRGLGGVVAMLRHPVRSIEYFTVPLMASSLRAAEDLSASALLRGLGSQTRPTSMHPPRFGVADAVALSVVILLAVATVLWRSAR
ncbi:energy-coupling factor transport system permease protein [Streptomyces sp. WMMB 714]|uniref:energy-coupling factor transporter transmembrane component T family protein n=1 Tax=Streptomyces sp. WMMB 714 TaxID=1286822 RepID=UPI000823B532|nr:energy-coupling factor transporter transmembrane component T [Streptomyces sp. WMMB 714]SCK41130.1 energy-coupling factor transport system permease protein [Streptomyces sp. WMMB 714]